MQSKFMIPLIALTTLPHLALGQDPGAGYLLGEGERRFDLTFPLEETTESMLMLRNRDGDTKKTSVSTIIILDKNENGNIEGDAVTTVRQTIDSARVFVQIRFFDSENVEIANSERWIFTSSRNAVEGRDHIWISERRAKGAAYFKVSQQSIDYYRRGADDPGPIDVVDNSTPKTYVFILPGLLGNSFRIERIQKMLDGQHDEAGHEIVTRVWDWTRIWRTQKKSIQERLYITEETCRIGRRFAEAVSDWRSGSKGVAAVHVIAMSAGTMVAKAACGTKNEVGELILAKDSQRLGKILFLSGALDIREPWDSLDICSDEIYNYYSYGDQVLATRFPTFLIFRIRVAVAWPACGGVGLKKQVDLEAEHIDWQLPWIRRENGGKAEKLGNDGGHLSPGCLSEDYFKEYILPDFTDAPLLTQKNGIVDGWDPDIHHEYMQDETGWGLPGRQQAQCP